MRVVLKRFACYILHISVALSRNGWRETKSTRNELGRNKSIMSCHRYGKTFLGQQRRKFRLLFLCLHTCAPNISLILPPFFMVSRRRVVRVYIPGIFWMGLSALYFFSLFFFLSSVFGFSLLLLVLALLIFFCYLVGFDGCIQATIQHTLIVHEAISLHICL